jgi:endonuclease/exonuclease/phosphatase family metal-dependent hydrolase
MSFNVRYGDADDGKDGWHYRHGLVARTIQNFEPDLLGVQEAQHLQCEEDYIRRPSWPLERT